MHKRYSEFIRFKRPMSDLRENLLSGRLKDGNRHEQASSSYQHNLE